VQLAQEWSFQHGLVGSSDQDRQTEHSTHAAPFGPKNVMFRAFDPLVSLKKIVERKLCAPAGNLEFGLASIFPAYIN
jgi:hypothetical protein